MARAINPRPFRARATTPQLCGSSYNPPPGPKLHAQGMAHRLPIYLIVKKGGRGDLQPSMPQGRFINILVCYGLCASQEKKPVLFVIDAVPTNLTIETVGNPEIVIYVIIYAISLKHIHQQNLYMIEQ